jgi:hypothetical protein
MFEAIVSYSDDVDTADAIDEILRASDEQLKGRVPMAGLLFCGTEYTHKEVLERIHHRFPGLQLIGCTTDGEMSSCGGFTEDAITLTLICSDNIRISAGYGAKAGAEPMAAAAAAVAMARKGLDGDPVLAIILPDGLTSSAFRILEGFAEVLGDGVPVVGGMSADRVAGAKDRYSTYQFIGDKVLTDAVPVLLFSGPLIHSLGVESGWTPIGEKMTVTRSQANVLYALDDKPAFELYVHYLGNVMKESMAGVGSYPLAIYEPGLDHYYLRVAKKADPETGAITFLGEIPEGAQVQITQAVRDNVMDGVTRSVASAIDKYRGDQPGVAMMFSCTGRKIALGTKAREEIGRARAGLMSGLPMTGVYTFGEIGPVSAHTRSRYHNTTFVTLLLGEK